MGGAIIRYAERLRWRNKKAPKALSGIANHPIFNLNTELTSYYPAQNIVVLMLAIYQRYIL